MFHWKRDSIPAEKFIPVSCNHDDKFNEILTRLDSIAERVSAVGRRIIEVQDTLQEHDTLLKQPIDKKAIHDEVERDRKAAARASKKNANTNATTEETPANG